MIDLVNSPLFPLEELSPETVFKLPKTPHAESKSVKLYIILAEPHVFLEGFTKDEVLSRPPSILRGCLFLRVIQPVKIKEITLKLKGVSRTEWPEGIPPKKVEHFEMNGIINHTWPFFNYLNTYPSTATTKNNADLFISRSDSEISNLSLDTITSNGNGNTSTNNSLAPTLSNDLRPIMSPVSLLKAFRNSSTSNAQNDLNSTLSNSGNDDNKLFPPGDYIYSFELPIQSSLPESVCVTFGSIAYSLEAHVERSGTFKTNLTAKRPVSIVRTPFENSSEENEPIIIDRDWENKLQYDIVIYSKQVILNSYLPISFRMVPLDKIKIHRLRVYMTEHLEYFCHNKKVHRTEPPKKILLLEHKPEKGSDNLLALGNDEIGGVELDFQVFVPEYYNERFHLHPDTTSENIQAHHWIKICIRISKSEPTPQDPDKRKQYELSIDSPMHLLSPHCVHANTLLPSYAEQIRLDTETLSDNTLTPTMPSSLGHHHSKLYSSNNSSKKNLSSKKPNSKQRESLDKLMSPRGDTILDSNLFKPDTSVPIEMLSPQAKPFSPIASPELNAISPELRDTPLFRSLELSPMISPIPTGRSRSNSKASTIRGRTLSPMSRTNPVLAGMSPIRLRSNSSTSLTEAPPPPFVEHPPSYEEATASNKAKTRLGKKSHSERRETTNSLLSIESSNSDNSGNSALSFSAKKPHSASSHLNSASTTPSQVHSQSVQSASNSSSSVTPTRISLNLGASMGNISGSNNGRSSSNIPTIGTGTMASSMHNESTPSISAFLNSPLPQPETSSRSGSNRGMPNFDRNSSDLNDTRSNTDSSKNGKITINKSSNNLVEARGRGREPSSYDLAQDSDLQFKITPIRSSSVSPFLRSNNSSTPNSGAATPMRSSSPIPIVANDRNLNKLISSVFTPGFSIVDGKSSEKGKEKDGEESLNAQSVKRNSSLLSPKIYISNSNPNTASDSSNLSPVLRSVTNSDLDTIVLGDALGDEFSGVGRPLLQDDELNVSDSSNNEVNNQSELSDLYHLHSGALGSLNSLDMMLHNNQSTNTLNSTTLLDLSRKSISSAMLASAGAVDNSHILNASEARLNHFGNNLDNYDDDSHFTDGTDITNMGQFNHTKGTYWNKLSNPKLNHKTR